MSLTKKDPSLRVAANDPHLVSLGGGRLSTAVTIHYIPIGHTTIGSSTNCSISLNGAGILANHCTIYRSEDNKVCIVPEPNARLLVDDMKITSDYTLSQGDMLTIGQYNLLRFNNPAQAEKMRSAMDSNDFLQRHSSSGKVLDQNDLLQAKEIEDFYEAKINPLNHIEDDMKAILNGSSKGSLNHIPPIDINGLQCPKVFTADLVTVNMPAKDVLGQKYASFAKNLAENHRQEKQINNSHLRNNQVNLMKQQNQTNGHQAGTYANIPNNSNFIQNSNLLGNSKTSSNSSAEYLTKVNNTSPAKSNQHQNGNHQNSVAYDRYPKPGTYGGLQIYPLNGINTEINNGSLPNSPLHQQNSHENSPSFARKRQLTQLSSSENDRLEDMLKICSEYADRQNHSSNSITSSPIVQNRIKTNGSLPREKKSPFHHDLSNSSSTFSGSNSNLSTKQSNISFNTSAHSSTGYENVRLTAPNRVEINGQLVNSNHSSSSAAHTSNSLSQTSSNGYENVIVGKYVPQSPRTKIRTTCISPKKEYSFVNFSSQTSSSSSSSASSTTAPLQLLPPPPPNPKPSKYSKQNEYEQLIKTFEEKLKIEMQAIEESSRYQPAASCSSSSSSSSTSTSTASPTISSSTSTSTSISSSVETHFEKVPAKRSNKNINNLTLTIHQQPNSVQNSPKLSKKPAPAPRTLNKNSSSIGTALTQPSTERLLNDSYKNVEQLKEERKSLLASIQSLKEEISELKKQEDEVLRDFDLEKALVSAELCSVGGNAQEYQNQLEALQNKIHRLEAQRNATRVMEENQQAKLKQSIEMKQDQIKKLKEMLKQKPNNECLKEEIHNVSESLENERKAFEDLEFQYLEEESEWHAYREELHAEESSLLNKIKENHLELMDLQKQELSHQVTDVKSIKARLVELFERLSHQQDALKNLEQNISDITGDLQITSSSDEEEIKTNFSPSLQDETTSSNLINGVMSQSLFGSAEILCPKRSLDDFMSKSVNENLFYNNKIELPQSTGLQVTSTPKRPQLRIINIDESLTEISSSTQRNDSDLLSPVAREPPPVLRMKRKTENDSIANDSETNQSERLKCNLSLGSDDFEVNPLEKRVPSQDDIDRICKVTSDAPISTKGAATTKIFDSIKEIERNRQLLLAQQGHHVIEHERQKMNDLKKKSHDEARAQYLSKLNHYNNGNNCNGQSNVASTLEKNDSDQKQLGEELQTLKQNPEQMANANKENQSMDLDKNHLKSPHEDSNQHRHSQPEYESHHFIQEQQKQQQQLQQQQMNLSKQQQKQETLRNSRPLSEANSEFSCGDPLSDGKSSLEFSGTHTTSSGIGSDSHSQSRDDKRASSHSNDSTSAMSFSSSGAYIERKRPVLPKHQRPLTRYLPIFSPDLNLRHHIETAGHQIALCPHVFVDSFSCKGYLHKLGATFHGWARRWFVLDRQRSALIYYSDKSERKPRGGAHFATIDEVYLDHLNASKSGRPHCTFIVKTKKRSYHLQAASDAAARIWIDAIITGAQGNLEY